MLIVIYTSTSNNIQLSTPLDGDKGMLKSTKGTEMKLRLLIRTFGIKLFSK